MGRDNVMPRAEAADDATMSAIALRLGSVGSIRSETLRAFTADEMQAILDTIR